MEVRASTIIGLGVMDAIDAAKASASIMLHGVPDHERELLLDKLTERGWRRRDDPSNADARHAEYQGVSVTLWGPRA